MERFDRLLEEQQKAIIQTDEKIDSLLKFATEYEDLRGRLEEMSKWFTKEALIPFSPKALIPGRFVHTNEVLVYLGGQFEHFCEVSTYQAFKIIDKRLGRIQESIKKLKEQRKLLTDREGFTQKLAKGEEPHSVLGAEENGEGEFEIREEYDPVKEKEWLMKHKKYVQKELARDREEAKKSLCRVRFNDGEEETENDSSDTSCFPDIEIHYSHNQSRPLNPTFSDLSKASPADIVAFVKRKNLKTKGILKNKEEARLIEPKIVHIEPFGEKDILQGSAPFNNPFAQVVERSVSAVSTSSSTNAPNMPAPKSSNHPISRFRLQHMSK
nr:unconventional prefoldin rpb5 interactor [Hymenolepis microstoma]